MTGFIVGPYEFRHNAIFWRKPTSNGYELVLLANFDARIVRSFRQEIPVGRDGCVELRWMVVVEVMSQSGRVVELEMLATRFAGMRWTNDLVSTGIVYPGCREHLRVAIQLRFAEAEEEVRR